MASPPMTYTVQARASAAGPAEVDAGSEIVAFDASWAVEPTGLPGPADLLASAFAACLLKNTERASKLLSFRYERAEVDVLARRQDKPPRFVEISYELRLVTAEPEHRVELLHHNLRKFGTVYNTLAAVCAVDGQVTATPPGTDR